MRAEALFLTFVVGPWVRNRRGHAESIFTTDAHGTPNRFVQDTFSPGYSPVRKEAYIDDCVVMAHSRINPSLDTPPLYILFFLFLLGPLGERPSVFFISFAADHNCHAVSAMYVCCSVVKLRYGNFASKLNHRKRVADV